MNTFKINELFGEAYNTAVTNIITLVNRGGWNWDYFNNWQDAHEFAEETKIQFDCNGYIVV